MNRRIVLGVTSALALALLPASVFAQAAAESALTHAVSSTATVKAGQAMNSALDKANKQLAGRVQREMAQPASRKTTSTRVQPASTTSDKGTAASEGATPGQGVAIASIQGGTTACNPGSPPDSKSGDKAKAEPAPADCSGQDSARKPAAQKNPSVVTLSFSK